MESHPEEEHYREHEAQRHDPFFGLLRTQFFYGLSAVLCRLFGGVLHVFEPRTASIVDSDTQNKRSTSHHECEVVTVIDVVAQTLLCPCHDLHRCGRREHSTDVNSHVEERERCVAAVGILRVVVEVAYHYLQVSFEKTGTKRDEKQGQQHNTHCKTTSSQRNSQTDITEEHNEDTDCDTLAVTDLICDPSAYERQKIDTCQKTGVDTAGGVCRQTEISAQEKRKHG